MKEIRKKLLIEENRQLSSRTWFLKLHGDLHSEIEKVESDNNSDRAGQFVNIEIPGKYLRRPISVNRIFTQQKELHLLYNIAGEGTKILSSLPIGTEVDVLIGLGNGFSIPPEITNPLLLGGGIGAAPLFQLAYNLVENGKKPTVVLGYNSKDESWGMEQQLREIGIATYVATLDGSEGTKGFVTDVIAEKELKYDYFYACGPMPMLRALSELPVEGELSLECRMGCGFGACVCCSIETVNGNKRICKEGPVFKKSELIWK